MDNTEGRIRALEQTIQRVESKLVESARMTSEQLRDISQSLHTTVRIEERMEGVSQRLSSGARSMEDMRNRITALELATPKRADTRLAELEREMPQLKDTSSAVRRVTWLVIAAVVAAVLALVVGKS